MMLDHLAEHVETHDSVFSRGYHFGYVRALVHHSLHDRLIGTARFPEAILGSMARAVAGADPDARLFVYAVEGPNQYGIRYVRAGVYIDRDD